jgi:hypothetical protein
MMQQMANGNWQIAKTRHENHQLLFWPIANCQLLIAARRTAKGSA